MISALSHFILRLFGWRTSAVLPENIVKASVNRCSPYKLLGFCHWPYDFLVIQTKDKGTD